MERNYEFRRGLLEVHKKDRSNPEVWQSRTGCIVDDTWEIVYPHGSGRVLRYAAHDLQEYFEVSLGVYLRVVPAEDITQAITGQKSRIVLSTAIENPLYALVAGEQIAYRLVVNENILICGSSERAAAQGCYYLEDCMNLNEGPVIDRQDTTRQCLFSPRMTHSGYGLDMFPDGHLKAIAHAGMDAILVFSKDLDRTPHGYLDFNELIYRAEGFGLDVYAYSYYISRKHPDEPDAEAFYESTYGRLFAECPGLKGVVLVGESMEFPSKDPHTTGRPYYENTPENNPDHKPSPGWYPCYDYPQWLNLVKKTIRSKNPAADIVFWSYNWGYIAEEPRLALIRALPTDISLLVTYEMFEEFKVSDKVKLRCVDYTLFYEGPGRYFVSEAEEAARRGIRLYTTCNTGGLTWDIGVIPYEPAPYQWKRRYDGLLAAKEKWGLCGLMESHHFGFYPSFVSELAKWTYWSPTLPFDEAIQRIAERDFGSEHASQVLDAWRFYSEGIRKYISTNEDQYGPFRIGPAYPLLYEKTVEIPSVFFAHFGNNKICHPMYQYNTANLDRLYYEIQSLSEMKNLYDNGNRILTSVVSTLNGIKKERAMRVLNLGLFISHCVQTTIHVKNWFILKKQLQKESANQAAIWAGGLGSPQENREASKHPISDDMSAKREVIQQMLLLAEQEIQNAEEAIPLVELDSRLGFEPSMEYMCDRAHLEWKIEVTRNMMQNELLPMLTL